LKWVRPTTIGDVVNIIPLKKPIPGIPFYVVAVNYAVFAISIFINYYLWCTCILCQILQIKGKYLSEVSVNKN
jgi:hypothetical protein